MPVSSVAGALNVNEATVLALENGQLDPIPGDYILIVSKLLETDFRYFISTDLDETEDRTRQIFRSLKAPNANDAFAIRRFVAMCVSERDLEVLLSVERRNLPSQYPKQTDSSRLHKEQGPIAARQERDRLRLGTLPIENIFQHIRSQGIRLFRHSLEDANLSGVTVVHPIAGVCMLINYDEDLYRQFFSAAHEYAHVLFDRNELNNTGCVLSYKYSNEELVELRANRFAAEFLFPIQALNKYSRPQKIDGLVELIGRIARDYHVNTAVVVQQMRQAKWITQRTLNSFFENRPITIKSSEKSDPEIPTDLTEAQSRRWIAAIEKGVTSYYLELLRRARTEEQITFGRFSEMLGLSVESAHDFVREAGIAL
ncbi:MAG: ImmA/IrrE family metallo-endopeptidase [Planctomycetaceae bacterium]|nr:ImmA/IrrE family metallo-endopeptidase [Planctomycetaceae bacterium]